MKSYKKYVDSPFLICDDIFIALDMTFLVVCLNSVVYFNDIKKLVQIWNK